MSPSCGGITFSKLLYLFFPQDVTGGSFFFGRGREEGVVGGGDLELCEGRDHRSLEESRWFIGRVSPQKKKKREIYWLMI